jgi:hypothetical protein
MDYLCTIDQLFEEVWTIVKNDLDVTSTASRELFTLVIL